MKVNFYNKRTVGTLCQNADNRTPIFNLYHQLIGKQFRYQSDGSISYNDTLEKRASYDSRIIMACTETSLNFKANVLYNKRRTLKMKKEWG